MNDQISPERKTAYYAGMVICAVGFLLFFSVFITGAMNFGNFDNFDGQVRSSAFRAIGGMVLMVVGQVIRGIGGRGLSGSGVVLDPKQAREDLKPYSKMAGGMLGDALEASNLSEHLGNKGERVVMIKCSRCGKLNEEDSKFCQECGNSFTD